MIYQLSKKKRYCYLFYSALFIWSLSFNLFNLTSLFEKNRYYSYIWLLIRGVLLLKILHDLLNASGKHFFIILLILMLAFVEHHYSKSEFIFPFLMFLAASRNCSIRKSITSVWIAQLSSLLLMISLASIGIVNNVPAYRYGESHARYAFGFDHPNTFGILLLQFSLISFFLFNEKRRKLCYVITLICFLLAYFGANSNTNSILLAFTFLFQIYLNAGYKKKKIFQKIMQKFSKLMGLLIPGLFVFFILVASERIHLNLGNLHTFLSRFTQAIAYYRHYSLTLFGQPLAMRSGTLYTLDNGYIHLLLGHGVIISLLFVLSYYLVIRQAVRRKDYVSCWICLIYGILGITETGLIRFYFNFSFLFFIGLIWERIKTQQ